MLFLWLLFKRKTFAKILVFATNVVRLKKQGKALDEVISAKATAVEASSITVSPRAALRVSHQTIKWRGDIFRE